MSSYSGGESKTPRRQSAKGLVSPRDSAAMNFLALRADYSDEHCLSVLAPFVVDADKLLETLS
jgi:hypothetical protein